MRTSTGARPPCEGADRRPGWSTARAGYHDPPSRADKNGLRRARHSVRTQGQRRRVGQGDSTCDRPSQTLSTMAMSHSTPAGLWGGNRVNRGGSRHDREGIHTRGAASRDMPCAQPCTVTRRAGPKAVPYVHSTEARGHGFGVKKGVLAATLRTDSLPGNGGGRRAHRVQPEGSRSAGRRWKARAADNHIPASESESNRWVRSQEVVNRWNAQEVGVCGIAWACIRGVGRTRWQKERSAHDAPSSKIFLGRNKPPAKATPSPLVIDPSVG